jgi:hypothetical protein
MKVFDRGANLFDVEVEVRDVILSAAKDLLPTGVSLCLCMSP